MGCIPTSIARCDIQLLRELTAPRNRLVRPNAALWRLAGWIFADRCREKQVVAEGGGWAILFLGFGIWG